MRSVLRLGALTLLALTPVAVCADPLVTVTLHGILDPTNAAFPITFSFRFDPVAYSTSNVPGFGTDFLYSTTPYSVPSNNTLDAADFSESGQYVLLYPASQFNIFNYGISFLFSPGSCQNLPLDPFSGAVPIFVTKTCHSSASGQLNVSTPSEAIDFGDVDFFVQPGAVTPEPPTALLLGSGLLLLGVLNCRSRILAG